MIHLFLSPSNYAIAITGSYTSIKTRELCIASLMGGDFRVRSFSKSSSFIRLKEQVVE